MISKQGDRMNNTTTVPHLVLERFPHIAKVIKVPDDMQGDLQAEHGFLYPRIMKDYRTEWEIVCEEIDKGIEAGTTVFNGATGEVTLLND
tara:strand:+ start:493 stop:762 length:270 start_codon:yes stop_codon:yes gene_type:complete